MNETKGWSFDDVCEEIEARDRRQVDAYNAKVSKKRRDRYVLRDELGPCPFEGDINGAPVVLLLGNPSSKDVVPGDHVAPGHDFPLWGLGPDASPELRKWWSSRLGKLIEDYGVRHVARSVAALQLNPWASLAFDSSLELGSRSLMFDIAESVIRRQGVLVVIRARKAWNACPGLELYGSRIQTNSQLCSYISPGNFAPGDWLKIVASVKPT